LSEYVDWVQNQTLSNTLDFMSTEKDDEDYLYDIIMTRLRTIDGLDLNKIQDRYGSDVVNCILSSIDEYIKNDEEELLTIIRNEQDWIVKLTDPNGFLVSNSILSIIFMGLDEYFSQKDGN